MVRNIGGIVAGLVAGIVAMMLIAFIGGLIFPTPMRVDPYDSAQVSAAFEASSMGAKLMVILSWFGAALAGGAVAKLISGERWAAWTVAGLFTVYVILSVFVLPMPGWMRAVAIAAPVVGGLLATHVGRRRVAATDDEAEVHAEV